MNLREWLSLQVYRNPLGFDLLRAARRLAAPNEYLHRRRLGRAHSVAVPNSLQVDSRLGFRFFAPGELPGLGEAIAALNRFREGTEARPEELAKAQNGRFRIAFDLLGDQDLEQLPEVMDFALSAVVDSVIEYMGEVPLLKRIAMGYSPGGIPGAVHEGSQLFHADGEDKRQLKLMVNLSDVQMENGPLTFLSSETSERVLNQIGRHHPTVPPTARLRAGSLQDSQVEELIEPDEVHRHLGPPGSAVLIDSSRCLHYGSRVMPGHDRLVFLLAYRGFHEVHKTPWNVLPPREPRTAIERALLDGRALVPAGTFYPSRRMQEACATGPAARGCS